MSSADVSTHSGTRLHEAAALTPFTTAREAGAAGAARRASRSGGGDCGPVLGSGALRVGGSRRKGPLSGAGGRGGAAAVWAPRGAVRRGSGCPRRCGRWPRRAHGCVAGGPHPCRARCCWRRRLCRPAAPRRASLLTSCSQGRGEAPGTAAARRERVPSPTSVGSSRPQCPPPGPPPAPPSRRRPRPPSRSAAAAGGSRRCWGERAGGRAPARVAAGAAILLGAGRAGGGARGVTAASFPRQEDAKGKKPKRREKLKRRGKAEGEQSAPEESGPGDGGLLQPPSAKKAKKSAEGNGAAEQNGSAPASGHGEAPAAEEPGSDAEVTAVRGVARAAPRARQRPAAGGCYPCSRLGLPAQMGQTHSFSRVAV